MALVDTADSEARLIGAGHRAFEAALSRHGRAPLARAGVTTLQINVGKVCNQACLHCHVEAGPTRTEQMTRATAERAMALVAAAPEVTLVDVTGGAPELNPQFAWIVREAHRLGRRVMVRHNLTVQFEPGQERLLDLFEEVDAEVVASLPCYGPDNVEQQRGKGVFDKSIAAIRNLNARGFGASADPGAPRPLHLVYNPVGASLPPPQGKLEADYRRVLYDGFGVTFTSLFTITNMPIKRFAAALLRRGDYDRYLGLLADSFNPATVDGLMCRSQINVGWDGALYDCDFNQMLELPVGPVVEAPEAAHGVGSIFALDGLDALAEASIATGAHCFGCTAGAGSSCGGALS